MADRNGLISLRSYRSWENPVVKPYVWSPVGEFSISFPGNYNLVVLKVEKNIGVSLKNAQLPFAFQADAY